MNLEVGKRYKTKKFYELTHATDLLGTSYEKGKITVVVEAINREGYYCMTILDGSKRIINTFNDGFFYVSDELIKECGIKFTEVEDD